MILVVMGYVRLGLPNLDMEEVALAICDNEEVINTSNS